VFLVNAEEAGSRVAVIEGEVRVQQGEVTKKLLPGEQVSTNPIMQTVPVIQEIQWSRNALAHLALRQQALLAPVEVAAPPVAPTQFEIASVRPCPPFGSGARGVGGARGGGGGGAPASSPGTLLLSCGPFGNTLDQLIRQAYLTYANGQRNNQFRNPPVSIEGGPRWLTTDRFEVNAKAEGNPSIEMMRGPMLQALL